MREAGGSRLISELYVHSFRHCLSCGFGGVEVFCFAPECDHKVISLIRIVGERKGLRNEDLGDLEESSGQAAVLLVADYCVDHGSSQRGAHQRQLLADGIHDADRIALRRVSGIPQQIQVGR